MSLQSLRLNKINVLLFWLKIYYPQGIVNFKSINLLILKKIKCFVWHKRKEILRNYILLFIILKGSALCIVYGRLVSYLIIYNRSEPLGYTVRMFNWWIK